MIIQNIMSHIYVGWLVALTYYSTYAERSGVFYTYVLWIICLRMNESFENLVILRRVYMSFWNFFLEELIIKVLIVIVLMMGVRLFGKFGYYKSVCMEISIYQFLIYYLQKVTNFFIPIFILI